MATALAARPAGSPDRELCELALDMRSTLPLDTTADIGATVRGLREGLVPLAQAEPNAIVRDPGETIGFRFDGNGTRRLADALRPIGLKLNPTMSAEQVGGWLSAMVAALSDLPARVALRGAQDALHHPIRFFPEVEGVVRDKAQPHASRYQLAIDRLRRLERDIAAASRSALPDAVPEMPTADRLAELSRTELGRMVLRLGLGNGHLAQEDFDAAMGPLDETEDR